MALVLNSDPALPGGILERRRRQVLAYQYALLRMLELESAWLALVRDTHFKIALGRKIGFDGMGLVRLESRLGEMFLRSWRPGASVAYAENFTTGAQLRQQAEIAGFLSALMKDLLVSMGEYLASQKDRADEPTVIHLTAMRAELSDSIAAFAPWVQSEPTLVGIDAPSSTPLVEYSGTEALPELVSFPGRGEELRFSEQSIIKHSSVQELLGNREHLARIFYRMYIDVEICAMELCGRNIVEYRDMPLAFKCDMARQVWDETRHAESVIDRMRENGAVEGQWTYNAIVWRRYLLGESLAERLAIEQVIQEGNAVDRSVAVTNALRAHGFAAEADTMDWLVADESQHALFGNRWLRYLCGGSQEKYEAIVARASAKVAVPLPPVNEYTRHVAGFEPWYIAKLKASFEENERRAEEAASGSPSVNK